MQQPTTIDEPSSPPPTETVEEITDPVLNDPVAEVSQVIEAQSDSLSCWIVDFVSEMGFPAWFEPIMTGSILLLCLAALAFLIFFFVRPLVRKAFTKLIHRSPLKSKDEVVEHGIARWFSHFISALLINLVIPGFVRDIPDIGRLIIQSGQIYLVCAGLMMINSGLSAAKKIYDRTRTSYRLPTTSLLQVMKLVAFLIALILIVSVIAQKSPLAFLGGLGVFTSVIMLVFKDPILGFAAGIQLTSNDMIKPGDWIEMPKHGADGNVLEVGLTTVKVMNWDKTVTTIPTYALISESFKNWRSMPESGGRRIKRSIFIDLKSIRLCDEEMLDRLRNIQFISEYIDQKQEEIGKWNKEHCVDPKVSEVNGRRLTNIGTFRAYIKAYLENSPYIHQKNMTLLVRQLASGPNGVPIEIYCFSNEVAWEVYENIQSNIFDHLFAVAPEFDLKVFQNPTDLYVLTSQSE